MKELMMLGMGEK